MEKLDARTIRLNGVQADGLLYDVKLQWQPASQKFEIVEIKPADQVEEGRYMIPVRAVAGSSSGDLNLEAVITGSYKIELTTPTGLLSTDIVAGGEKKVTLVVKNTGTSISAASGLITSTMIEARPICSGVGTARISS